MSAPTLPADFGDALVIAISSRALFDMRASHAVFENDGLDAYSKYQIARETEPLGPGVAFPMVQKFLRLNDAGAAGGAQKVEIVLLSRNSADTGLRIFKSIEHNGLDITRAAFTGGQSPYRHVKSFGAHLFLSADPADVRRALESGVAAATVLPPRDESPPPEAGDPRPAAAADAPLKIAFDGDAVLFSDEAEQVFRARGKDAFNAAEKEKARAGRILPGGPFKNLLAALHTIQRAYPADASPIRTALITARSAPAHERVIKTLRAWDIRIDESYFLGGMEKGEFLRAFGADIFFDDHIKHCEAAREHVPTGHVPHGIINA